MTEREAIVAWLRKEAAREISRGLHENYCAAEALEDAAKAIEAGQHLENKDVS
jgi:hypothetical protein